jgi:hypothetical protein
MKKKTKQPAKTQIFEYKGVIGIIAGDKFVNDPAKPGQLGCIVDGKDIIISAEALALLKQVKKSHDAIGDVMCWKAGEKICFGWLGGPKKLVVPAKSEGDREYNPGLLEVSIGDVKVPQDFIEVVDKKEDQ